MRQKWWEVRCAKCGALLKYQPKPNWNGKIRCPRCYNWTEVLTLEKVNEMAKGNQNEMQVKPVVTVESTPAVGGVNEVDEYEKFRERIKDDKLKLKADEVHKVLLSVKPGPVKLEPSKGWLSYIADVKPKPVRYAALVLGSKDVRIHSVDITNGKVDAQQIKINLDDAIPTEKIRSRAESFIASKVKKVEPPRKSSTKIVKEAIERQNGKDTKPQL